MGPTSLSLSLSLSLILTLYFLLFFLSLLFLLVLSNFSPPLSLLNLWLSVSFTPPPLFFPFLLLLSLKSCTVCAADSQLLLALSPNQFILETGRTHWLVAAFTCATVENKRGGKGERVVITLSSVLRFMKLLFTFYGFCPKNVCAGYKRAVNLRVGVMGERGCQTLKLHKVER